jgi:hypothetical protein
MILHEAGKGNAQIDVWAGPSIGGSALAMAHTPLCMLKATRDTCAVGKHVHIAAC